MAGENRRRRRSIDNFSGVNFDSNLESWLRPACCHK